MTDDRVESECRFADRLEAMLADRLGDTEGAVVEAHIEGCPACQADLARMTGELDQMSGVLVARTEDAVFLDRLKGLPWAVSPADRDRAMADGMPAIAGFRLLREVGRGGMGTVYEATELALGRRVALKVVPRAAVGTSNAAMRFRREARAAARLHHTNIVPVFGVGEDAHYLYYAMQFIEGETLNGLIQRLRVGGTRASLRNPADGQTVRIGPSTVPDEVALTVALSASESGSASVFERDDRVMGPPVSTSQDPTWYREVARFGAQVAEALAFAHAQGILHRDVKPSNILIDDAGEAWVADFGLAKTLDAEADGLTRTGDIVGTLRYMAPERFDGHSDPRGDVYALGATLFEMLTLRPVFAEANRAALIERILREQPPRPRSLDRRIPPDLETIVVKAMAKEPASRYASAAAMAEDLRRYLAGESILARRAGTFERGWRWSRRNPVVASLLTILALVLVGGFAGMARLWVKAEASATAARSSADRAGQLAASESRTRAASILESARLEIETGTLWARQGRIGRGLLWMDRGLQTAPVDADSLRRATRADMAAWVAAAINPTAALGQAGGPLNSLTLSPDGRTLAVGVNGVVHLWDMESRTPLGALDTPGMAVQLNFVPGGRQVVTSSQLTGLRLWDLATRAKLRQLTPEVNFMSCAGFSPDGRRMLAQNHYTGVASMVSLTDDLVVGKPMIHGVRPAQFALSPDGTRVVSGGEEGQSRLWDAATGQPIGAPIEHGHAIRPFFAPSGGSYLIVGAEAQSGGAESGHLSIYETATRALRTTIVVATPIHEVVFRPDGRSFLVFERTGVARLFDLATGRQIGEAIRADSPAGGHGDWSNRLAVFSPDGQTVATTHMDNTVRLWDALTGRPMGPILEHNGGQNRMVFRPDGHTLLTADQEAVVRVWEIAPAFAGRVLPVRADALTSDLSPDGRMLALAHEGVVRLVDRETGLAVAPPMIHDAPVPLSGAPPLLDLPRIRAVRFSPDGKTLATGGDDGAARLWDVATGQPKTPPLKHEHWVLALAFSPDGTTLATGTVWKYARLWNVANGQPISDHLPQLAPTGQSEIEWVGFSGDGTVLVTDTYFDPITLWQTRDGAPIDRGGSPAEASKSKPQLSPDGFTLLIHDGREQQIWDLNGPRMVGRGFGPDRGGLAFRPDGKRLVTLGETSARIWDVASRSVIGSAMEHPATPTAAVFTPDGSEIITGASDGMVRRWDAATGRPIGPPLEHGQPVGRLFVPPDGRSVVAVGSLVSTWSLNRPLDDGPGLTSKVAQRIAMRELRVQGDTHALSASEWTGLADAPTSSPAEAIAFHDRLAARYESQGRSEAALWHLDRLIGLRPDLWSDFARRSTTQRALGHRALAEADAARAEALGPPALVRAWLVDLALTDAQVAIRAADLAGSLALLGRLMDAQPGYPPLIRRRIKILAGLGMWTAVERDMKIWLESGPATLEAFYWAALLRVASGDRDGYQDLCLRLLREAGSSRSLTPGVANSLAWSLAVGSTGEPLPASAIALARRATETPALRPAALNTLGAILYRAGLHAQSIEAIEQGMRLRADAGVPQDWAFLAMAHARLGHPLVARGYLDQLDRWHASGHLTHAFEDLEISLLRREAHSAIAIDNGFPSNPFQP